MKKLFLTLTALILVFGCAREYNDLTNRKLQRWDSEIWERNYIQRDTLPSIILDSLSSINTKKLSNKTEAYYNLLYTIVSDKADVPFTSDSVISKSVNYYQESEEYYNYARALLYEGIVKYRIDPYDTSSYYLFKNAEKVYDLNHLSDLKLLAHIYSQLGSTNYEYKLFNRSLDYFCKSTELYKQVNDTFNIYNSYCNIVYTLLPLERYNEAFEKLSILTEMEPLPSSLFYNYIDCMSMYYKSIGDIINSLIYKKKILLGDRNITNMLGVYFSIANSYHMINQRDSCLYYTDILKNELTISDNPLKDKYYKAISEIYYDYQQYADFKECTDSAFSYSDNASIAKLLELEKQYDVFIKDQTIKEIRQHNIILMVIIVLSLVILLTLLIVFIQYRKLKKEEILKKEIEKENISLINKILFFSCKTIPEMISKIDKLDGLSKSSMPSDYNDYMKAKREIETDYKDSLRTFVSEELSKFQYLHKEDHSTTQDTVITLLSDNNYSNKDIGSILNISPDAVRAALSRINSKKKAHIPLIKSNY